jgi:hypothetical protein
MSEKYTILRGGAQSVDNRDDNKVITIESTSTFNKLNGVNHQAVIDANEQFIKERNSCTDYRLILTVNPYFTNVLFNSCTEIVKDEGSDNPIVADDTETIDIDGVIGKTTKLTRYDMIRNTEYSSEKHNFVYHPGLDIFNNHILRNKSFRCVNPLKKGVKNPVYFNTIEDYMRRADGEYIEKCNRKGIKDTKFDKKHLYDEKDILKFETGEAIQENLRNENGWFGFYNTSTIVSKDINGEDMDISRAINNRGNCEFIDMYPDRTLFSLIPKYNEHKNRLEPNWDFELTYPFEHTTVRENGENFEIIQHGDLNALYIASAKYIVDGNGRQTIMFKTLTKHNLHINDKVYMYFTYNEGDTWNKSSQPYMVTSIGDLNNEDKDYYFTIQNIDLLEDIFSTTHDENYSDWDYVRDNFYREYTSNYLPVIPGVNLNVLDYGENGLQNIPSSNDIIIKVGDKKYELYNSDTNQSFISLLINDINSSVNLFIRNIINNAFQKSDSSTHEEGELPPLNSDYIQFRMVKTNGRDDCQYYVRKFEKIPNMKNGYEGIENMPFDKEQYPLAFANTIYGDPILQLTYTDKIKISQLKDNLGRDLTDIYVTVVKRNGGDDKTEFSKCFGPVTSGFNFHHNENDNLTIRKKCHVLGDVTMINNNGVTDNFEENDLNNLNENDITIKDEWFYGDIVEFDPNSCKETVLCDVNYRFNTAQRETGVDYKFKYDEIDTDDFDGVFKVTPYEKKDCIIRPEGYYYKPHYKIKLRGFGSVEQATHKHIYFKEASPIQDNGIYIKISTLLKHNARAGEYVLISDPIDETRKWKLEIVYVIDNFNFVINKIDYDVQPYCDWINLCKNLNNGSYQIKRVNNNIPENAIELKNGTYLWRPVINSWDIANTDTELKDLVFTNNCFYIDKSINIYLKRQDPEDINNLYYKDPEGIVSDIVGNIIYEENNEVYKPETEALC